MFFFFFFLKLRRPPRSTLDRSSAASDGYKRQLTRQARVIAEAMETFGLIVADNGTNWFFQGAPNPGWDDDDLDQLKDVPGSAFEVVDTGPVLTG